MPYPDQYPFTNTNIAGVASSVQIGGTITGDANMGGNSIVATGPLNVGGDANSYENVAGSLDTLDASGMISVSSALARMSGVREDELDMLSENELEAKREELLKAKARAAAAEEVRDETTETPAAPTFESGLGTFHIGLFLDGCSPKKCPEWDCAKWCHCFETNPNVEAMFESVQYSASLAALCPEDDTTCQC